MKLLKAEMTFRTGYTLHYCYCDTDIIPRCEFTTPQIVRGGIRPTALYRRFIEMVVNTR